MTRCCISTNDSPFGKRPSEGFSTMIFQMSFVSGDSLSSFEVLAVKSPVWVSARAGRIWIGCVFKRRDGVPLSSHPQMATWDNQEIGVEVRDNDGAGGKLLYRVMINPSTTQARIEQARAAQKVKNAP